MCVSFLRVVLIPTCDLFASEMHVACFFILASFLGPNLVTCFANTSAVEVTSSPSSTVLARLTESSDIVEVFVPETKEKPKTVLYPWRPALPASITYLARLTAQDLSTTAGGRWQLVVDNLPESIKNTLNNNPTNISDADLKRLDIGSAIGALSQDFLRILNSNQVITIVRGFQEKENYRDAAKALEALGSALNTSQIVQLITQVKLSIRCDRDVQAMFRQALRYLDSPDTWNMQLWREKQYDKIAPFFPADLLMRVEEQNIAKRLLGNLSHGLDGSFGCGMTGVANPSGAALSEQIVHIHRVMLKLIMAGYGRQSDWTPEVLQRYSDIAASMTIQSLQSIQASVIGQTISDLASNTEWDDAQGYTLASRWAEDMGNTFNTMSAYVFGLRLDSLGQIMPYFVPEMLPAVMNSSQYESLTRSWADAMDRWRTIGGRLPPRTAVSLLRYKLQSMPPISAMTSEHFNRLAPSNMGPSLLKVGPRTLLNAAEKVGFLNAEVLRRLVADDSGGVLRMGDLKRLGTLAVQANKNGGKVNIENLPSAYMGSIPASDLQILTSSELAGVVNQLNENANSLSTYALFSVYSKIRESRSAADFASLGFGPFFKDVIPAHDLKSIAATNVYNLAFDMPADSPTRLVYSKLKTRDTNLTYDDLQRDPLLVATLTQSQIANINLPDTPNSAWAIRNAAQGPSVQAIRGLHSKLRSFTKVRRVDNVEDDTSILENTWLSNIDMYPATVLACFSSTALSSVNDSKKAEILRGLGNLPLIDYYTIHKSKRQTIVQQGLKALGRDTSELTDGDVVYLGNAVVDLQASDIKKLTPRALEYSLPVFQGQGHIFPGLAVRPCLTSDQRTAIFNRIKASYGNPGSWNSGIMDVVCCSLDLVPVAELAAIRDDVILECQCVVDNEPPAYLSHLRDSLNVNCIAELGANLHGLTEGLQNVRKRKAEAALRIKDFFVNRSPNSGNFVGRKKRAVTPVSCDVITHSQFGASGFTPAQLETLSDDDMRNCLYEMGAYELSAEQAQTLLRRLLFTYDTMEDIPNREVLQMGWIARALNTTMIQELDFSNADIIAAFGAKPMFVKEQLQALARQVNQTYRTSPNLASFTSQDLVMLGYILCGYDPEIVKTISLTAYMGASFKIGQLYGCDSAVLSSLANLAASNSSPSYGNPSTWDAATVRTVGVVIGGLRAEQLNSIPADALTGLTPKAVVSIDPQNFKAFRTEQLRAFPLAVAQGLTPAQRGVLIGEMQDALNWVVHGNASGTSKLIFNSVTGFVVILMNYFIYVSLYN